MVKTLYVILIIIYFTFYPTAVEAAPSDTFRLNNYNNGRYKESVLYSNDNSCRYKAFSNIIWRIENTNYYDCLTLAYRQFNLNDSVNVWCLADYSGLKIAIISCIHLVNACVLIMRIVNKIMMP